MEIVLSGSQRRWGRMRRVLAVAAVVAAVVVVAGALVLPMPTTARVVAVGLPALVLTLVSLLVLLGALRRPAGEPGEGPDDRGERHSSPPDRGAGGGRALDGPATVSDLPHGALGSVPREGSGGGVAHSASALLMLVPSPRRPWDDSPGDLGRLVR